MNADVNPAATAPAAAHRMTAARVADLANELFDLARAAERRLDTTAGLVASPALKAHLSLAASAHARDAHRLHGLVRLFRGTPHDGITDALLADPLWASPPQPQRSDPELLARCLAEEATDLARLDAALRLPGLPDAAREVIQACRDGAQARHRSLQALLQTPP